MTQELFIHATITVRGNAADLEACRARMERALNALAMQGEAGEHHGPDALCYDLKIQGGLPFPAFVDVSVACPDVSITIEWVNLDAGQRGAATIVAGQLAERDIGAIEGQAQSPVCVRIAPDGRLVLACTLLRAGPDECRGYAVEAARDAVFRAAREPGGAMELSTTEGAAEWAFRWRLEPGAEAAARAALDPPQPIAEAEFQALERIALDFAAEWVWLSESPETEVAVERARLKRRGHIERAANLRSGAYARIERAGVLAGGMLTLDTLPEDLRWVEALLTRCWLGEA